MVVDVYIFYFTLTHYINFIIIFSLFITFNYNIL